MNYLKSKLTTNSYQRLTIVGAVLACALLAILSTSPVHAQETTVTKYFDDRTAAMALNFDTELYMAGLIHSESFGYDPPLAISRAQEARLGWPNIIADSEAADIPVSFNICCLE